MGIISQQPDKALQSRKNLSGKELWVCLLSQEVTITDTYKFHKTVWKLYQQNSPQLRLREIAIVQITKGLWAPIFLQT